MNKPYKKAAPKNGYILIDRCKNSCEIYRALPDAFDDIDDFTANFLVFELGDQIVPEQGKIIWTTPK